MGAAGDGTEVVAFQRGRVKSPGFAGTLSKELEAVLPEFKKHIERSGGLTAQELVSLTARPDADPALYHPDHAWSTDVAQWTDVTAVDEATGEQAIKNNQVAFVLLAGGVSMSTLLAPLPKLGLSLLGWKLLQAGNMPVWIMAQPGMSEQIQRHISTMALPVGMNGCVFEQFEGMRLTPDNRLLTSNNLPELYPLGHGDVGPALIENGVLDDNPNIKYAYVTNVDNALSSPHPGVIGHHIRLGCKVTCEVVERQKDDRGGVVAWVNNQLQVAEDFRLPTGFAAEAKYHNTNTMVIDTDVLRWPIPWRWHRVRKQVGSRLVIQYERLLQQYTEECRTNFLAVPREARFFPVKTAEDLHDAGALLSTYRFQ